MTGVATAYREAVLTLEIRGPENTTVRVKCVGDTDFTEFLTWPAGTIASLGLPYQATEQMLMADGRSVQAKAHGAVALWDGAERAVNVQDSDEPLVGMAMLHGHRVTMDVVDDGALTIEPLAEAG
jgi:predicted aspartyl protease